MNFVQTFLKGKAGHNLGLTTGITKLDQAINGINKKHSYGLAAAPKCGKTALADYCFVLSPYLQMEREGKLANIEWEYFSYEIDRVSKEFKFAAFFMFYDYNVFKFRYKDKEYSMTQDYLMGKMLHTNRDNSVEVVQLSEEHEGMLKDIYLKRIIPLFGEYDDNNNLKTKGKITFIEESENPTGVYKYLVAHAKQNGHFVEESYSTYDEQGNRITKKRITGYKANNPEMYTIIVADHVRKFKRERGFTMKENIDKWLEYSTWLRNTCSYIFVNVCHSGRQLANMDRLRYAGEFIYPTGDDVKDTGNLSEESTVLLTMFNPNDEKYNLDKHFGVELKDFPFYRSIHVADSRYTECPAHIQVNMFGGINLFSPIQTNYNY